MSKLLTFLIGLMYDDLGKSYTYLKPNKFPDRVIIVIFFALFFLQNQTLHAQKPEEYYPKRKYKHLISNLTIPIEMEVDTMQKIINTQMDSLIYEIKDLNNESVSDFSMEISRLDTIKIHGEKSSLYSIVPLQIKVKGKVKFKLFNTNFERKVDQIMLLLTKFRTKLALNYDWNLISKTSLLDYKWIKEPYLKVMGIKFPMGRFVNDMIEEQKDSITYTIDQQLQKQFDLKKQIEITWKTFQLPFVASVWGEEKTWLYFSPLDEKILIEGIHFDENKLRTKIQVQGYSDAEFSKSFHFTPKIVEIPDLSYREDLETGAEMLVNARVSKKTALKKANEVFLHQEYSFRKDKYKVKVEKINFYGSGDNLVIDLDLSGSVDGKVYLIGKPVYNSSSDNMEIKDFSYELDAKTKISKFTRWLFAGKIKKQLKSSAEEVLNQQIRKIRKDVEKNLESFQFSSQATLKGDVDDFYVKEIYMDAHTVFAKIILLGDFQIVLHGF